MFKTVTTTNFRQHEDRTFTFGPGVNVIRGQNEGGKSTMMEAILYAGLGVKACRNNDLATWGKPENSQKVEVVVEFDDVYTISRSKRGAEVKVKDEVIVTGQTEVTRWFEERLGMPVGASARLMFSLQGDIRGVLDQGGAKTAELIEQLAGTDQIAKVISLIQDKLVTGNAGAATSAVASAKENLESAQNELESLRTKTDRVALCTKENNLAILVKGIPEVEATVKALKAEVTTLEDKLHESTSTLNKLSTAEQAVRKAQEGLQTLETQKPDEPADSQAAQLKLAVEMAEASEVIKELKLTVEQFEAKHSATRVSGSLASWEAKLTQARDAQMTLQKQVMGAESEVRLLQSQLVTSSICGFCQQDLSQFPEVKQKNDATQLKIDSTQSTVADLKSKLAQVQDDLQCLEAICKTGRATVNVPSQLMDLVVAHAEFTPVKYEFIGHVGDLDLAKAKAEFTAYTAKVSAWNRWEGRLSEAESNLKSAELELLKAKDKVAGLDTVALTQACTDANTKLSEANRQLDALKQARFDLGMVQAEIASFDQMVERQTANVARFQAQLDSTEKYLSDLQFNNALLRAVREAKPAVTDKIWTLLLAAVSSHFSRMRGQDSRLSKSDDGFLVDGKEIGSLSGSTLDVLGLAIRVALTKSFLPGCRSLLLDEPFAACDAERQQAALGFLASCGFEQIVLVTHEDTSEAVADHLIEV